MQNLEGYKTITLPYKTTDVIRKSKDVDWFSTWILLLDAEQQPILSAINVLSGNNFSNPGWDEWKLPEETLQNEPKYQNARYVKVGVSTFGATKDFNQFMVTIKILFQIIMFLPYLLLLLNPKKQLNLFILKNLQRSLGTLLAVALCLHYLQQVQRVF